MNANPCVIGRPSIIKRDAHETGCITRNYAEDVRLTHVLLGAVAAAHHQCLNNLAHKLMNRIKRGNVVGPLIEVSVTQHKLLIALLLDVGHSGRTVNRHVGLVVRQELPQVCDFCRGHAVRRRAGTLCRHKFYSALTQPPA
jgi:hypothetical protein